MIILLSPSKTLDFDSNVQCRYTIPRALIKSEELIKILRKLRVDEIAKLMDLSDKLSELNYQRYQDFNSNHTESNSKPAIFTFKGDVYDGIDIDKYSRADIDRAQDNIRILSGLYGLLRPLDLIQPYRLEMGTALKNDRGGNLYKFWGDDITALINEDLKGQGSDVLINLASGEYFKAINTKNLAARVITPVFKEYKNGSYKMLMVYVKKARGMMASYIIKNNITNPEDIKSFNIAGYVYNNLLSKGNEWVFTR